MLLSTSAWRTRQTCLRRTFSAKLVDVMIISSLDCVRSNNNAVNAMVVGACVGHLEVRSRSDEVKRGAVLSVCLETAVVGSVQVLCTLSRQKIPSLLAVFFAFPSLCCCSAQRH